MDGADALPIVNITVAGTDVTDEFVQTESPVTQWRTYDPIPIVSNTIRYSCVTLDPNKLLNEKEIIFQVTGKLAKADVRRLNLYVNVFYKPVVTYQSSRYYARLGDIYSLMCYVRSNPRALLTYKHSGRHSENGSPERIETYATRQTKISPECTEIGIHIHRVHKEHFGRYIITGVNQYGRGQVQFSLIKECAEAVKPRESALTETVSETSNSLPQNSQHNSSIKSSSDLGYLLVALFMVTRIAFRYRAAGVYLIG